MLKTEVPPGGVVIKSSNKEQNPLAVSSIVTCYLLVKDSLKSSELDAM